MTDHEKEILDKIKQSTEKTPVPESLAPDQIMKMLEEHNSTQASGHIPKKHGFSRGYRMRGGLIAAALYWLSALAPTSASRIFLQTQPLLPQKAVLQSIHPPVSLPLPIL